MHPEFHADKNCTGRDGIIYVLVNLLGRLTALTLRRGIDGMSNFLLQTNQFPFQSLSDRRAAPVRQVAVVLLYFNMSATRK